MADLPPASLRLKIDRDAIAHNWQTLDRLSGAASAGAAVKADAYGVGVDYAVPALRDAGARAFFVAHWSEVPAVLKHVPAEQVAVLHGPANAADAAFARATGVLPVINSIAQARVWTESGGGLCHVMVDTGINRLGLSMGDIGDPAVQSLEVDVLLSHLASADEDIASNRKQFDRFETAIEAVPHRRTSLANSAGIGLGTEYAFDLTRPGLSLYGGVQREELVGEIRQVVFPQAAILQTRRIEAGEGVGYNAQFVAPCDMRIAVVSLGYADGFLRMLGPDAVFRFDGKELPVLGKVSMDMIVVDASEVEDLREGDWVDIPLSLPETARRSGLSQYEILTTLGSRYDRGLV